MFDLQGFGHLLFNGAWVTIKLALTSLAIGMVLGLLGAAGKRSNIWLFRQFANLYTTVMRGIPELLLVLFLYFGGQMILTAILESLGHHDYVELSAFWAGVVALSVAFGAYAPEVLRMASQELYKGQWEAAKAVGMRPSRTFWRIILPQVWKLALPGLGNLFLVLIKDTALVSVVGLKDIMYQASRAAQSTQQAFTFYMAAALIYLALTVIVTAVMMWLEWRANPAKRYRYRQKRLQRHLKNKNNQQAQA